jgi:hypothetical protein
MNRVNQSIASEIKKKKKKEAEIQWKGNAHVEYRKEIFWISLMTRT